jgi:hypothetical protein
VGSGGARGAQSQVPACVVRNGYLENKLPLLLERSTHMPDQPALIKLHQRSIAKQPRPACSLPTVSRVLTCTPCSRGSLASLEHTSHVGMGYRTLSTSSCGAACAQAPGTSISSMTSRRSACPRGAKMVACIQ